ncbi:hypothetical protein Plhal304r1_c064g0151561 [Plasmopara halstedii]
MRIVVDVNLHWCLNRISSKDRLFSDRATPRYARSRMLCCGLSPPFLTGYDFSL